MPFEFSEYEQLHPDAYRNLLTKISVSKDTKNEYKYFYSIGQKEGSWFGSSTVNLIIAQSLLPSNRTLLYFQKTLEMDRHHRYQQLMQPLKSIELTNIKMIARKQRRITIAYITQKDELKEWNLGFASGQLAEEWEQLLRDKKNQALQTEKEAKDKLGHIERLSTQIKNLEGQLSVLKLEYDNLLKEYKRVNEENKHYRQLVNSLENELLKFKTQSVRQLNLKEAVNLLQRQSAGSIQFNGSSFSILKSIEYLCSQLIVELSDLNLNPGLKRLVDLIKDKLDRLKDNSNGSNQTDLVELHSFLDKQMKAKQSL